MKLVCLRQGKWELGRGEFDGVGAWGLGEAVGVSEVFLARCG